MTGHVDLRGDDITVVPPAALPVARRILLASLLSNCGAVEQDDVFHVPVGSAQQLSAQLGLWPASEVDWIWSPRAQAAQQRARDAMDAHDGLMRVLRREVADPSSIQDELDAIGFARTLQRPFQPEAVAELLAMVNGGNFSVPGSGKTTVAYATWALARARGQVGPLLVVSPVSAFEAWETEAVACFTPGARPTVLTRPRVAERIADVVLINYARLEQAAVLAEVDRWVAGRPAMVVFDEAHRVKAGQRGVRGRAAARLAPRFTRRYVLTGTPVPNDERDLAAIFDLCWPGHGERLATGDLSPHRSRIFVRTTKDELELPPVELRREVVDLERPHRALYDALVDATLSDLDVHGRQGLRDLGRAVMRLLAAATNPALVFEPGSALRWPDDHELPESVSALLNSQAVKDVRPAKLVRAAQLVAENAAAGKKTLVWSVFVGNVNELARMLSGLQPAVVTGSTPVDDPFAPTDRVRELARFRSDRQCRVLIATPQTLGEGISLHRVCTDQIHVDRTFSAGLMLQSLDRTHRLGIAPDAEPTATLLLANRTVDARVQEVLDGKLAMMREVLNDPSLGRLSLPDVDVDVDLADLLLDDANAADLQSMLEMLRSDPVRAGVPEVG